MNASRVAQLREEIAGKAGSAAYDAVNEANGNLALAGLACAAAYVAAFVSFGNAIAEIVDGEALK